MLHLLTGFPLPESGIAAGDGEARTRAADPDAMVSLSGSAVADTAVVLAWAVWQLVLMI